MAEEFSLLMSVWAGDDPDFLEAAFRSVVHDQTRPPDDVVLVQDGPVPDATRAIGSPSLIDDVAGRRPRCWRSTRTSGSASRSTRAWRPARTTSWPGWTPTTSRCRSGSRSRCRSSRTGVDLVGSALLEFGADPSDIVGKRVPPIDPDEIVRYARFHQPFNHPTVVYRRTAVEAAGGYRHLALMEDYLLFAKMIEQGCTGRQRRGAAGALPGRRGRLRPARRCGVAQVRVAAAAHGCAGWASPLEPSSSAMSWFAAAIGWCPERHSQGGVPPVDRTERRAMK